MWVMSPTITMLILAHLSLAKLNFIVFAYPLNSIFTQSISELLTVVMNNCSFDTVQLQIGLEIENWKCHSKRNHDVLICTLMW